MRNKLHARCKLRNTTDLSVSSLVSRPWFSLAHTLLLSLCMSSLYIMIKLLLTIPARWTRYFDNFRRGGLAATTDLLIFASAALLFCLLLIAVITLRMQVRLSWRANQENYHVLLQIGMSKAELKHSLRVEGLLLLIAAALPSAIISKILFLILMEHWNLDELNASLAGINYTAIASSVGITIALLEFSRIKLVHKLGHQSVGADLFTPSKFRRLKPQTTFRKQIWFDIMNHSWKKSPYFALADLLTISISLTLIFSIYAIKAGIDVPRNDSIAAEVSYDLRIDNTGVKILRDEIKRLLYDLPEALQGKAEVIFINEQAEISINVPASQINQHFKDLLEDKGKWPAQDTGSAAIPLDFKVFPLSRQSYNEFFGLDSFSADYSSISSEQRGTGSYSYDDWLERSAAILLNEINYVPSDRLISDKFSPFTMDEGQMLPLNKIKEGLDTIFISRLIEERPWYIDPISDSLVASIIIPEELYRDLYQDDKNNTWVARVRIDENSLISFQTIVKRDWTPRKTSLMVVDHYGRRMEQARIHHSLDILFNLSLFFIFQFTLIQLVAFTQGQYFIREAELKLLKLIGIDWLQERSIIRYYCLRIYALALLCSYLITYTASQIWNRLLQPITAVSITWPIMALLSFSLGLTLIVIILSQIRFKRYSVS